MQNAQLAHIPTSPTPLTHKGCAFGLTRLRLPNSRLKRSQKLPRPSQQTGDRHPKLQKSTIPAAL
ncbi:hypothetical protein BLL52_2974 [Rhodoferax antarcticus ANT.BR]|uniref:Uncharacterized protein n=1 Tax=Rhodoferax antarcticus ANT.BR TaxID=1111071 RepID=A0A1Q8YFB0_9BURK|nr:hypothetical protein BLL52_2974 [Rhodoferax antarcticus ANT.BR]